MSIYLLKRRLISFVSTSQLEFKLYQFSEVLCNDTWSKAVDFILVQYWPNVKVRRGILSLFFPLNIFVHVHTELIWICCYNLNTSTASVLIMYNTRI